jgi:hypothetical protein
MSYTLFVEGKITETTGGEHNVFSDKIISFNANGVITQTGEENGVSFNTPLNAPPPPPTPLTAKCIVQFRPRSNWKGEFGFDWFRIGDTGLNGDTNYETLIGQYYTKVHTDPTTVKNRNGNLWTPFFKTDPQPAAFTGSDRLSRLKSLYGEFTYSLANDSSGNPVNKKYYKPILALFPRVPDPANPRRVIEPGEAELELYLEFQEINGKVVKPDKIIFEMDNVLMDANHPLVHIDKHTLLQKDLSKKINIKITCTASFSTDKEIKVGAVTLDETGQVRTKLSAGVLRMIAPDKRTTKEVVIVTVYTSAGEGSKKDLDILKKNLKQALITTNITEQAANATGVVGKVLIDVSNPTNNHLNINFNTEFRVTRNNILNKSGGAHALNLQNYLTLELERAYPGQFTHHFKLFFFKKYV